MRFAPRMHPFILERIWAVDDGQRTVAGIWRDVGREATRVDLARPGYHSVRVVVRAERERREARNEAILIALEEATRWAPDGLRVTDHVAAAARLSRRR